MTMTMDEIVRKFAELEARIAALEPGAEPTVTLPLPPPEPPPAPPQEPGE